MPYTTNVAGTTITASWGNANVRDQVVSPFTDSTARASAISAPVAGMLSTLTTTGRLDIYNGSSWSAVLAPMFGAATAWTPTLTAVTTNPTLGTGSSTLGGYYRMGRLILAWGRILWGTAGAAAGTGNYQISMPVTGDGRSAVPLGIVHSKVGGAFGILGTAVAFSSTLMNWYAGGANLAASTTGFTNNDTIGFWFLYEAAADG